jgi:hypothetical protein
MGLMPEHIKSLSNNAAYLSIAVNALALDCGIAERWLASWLTNWPLLRLTVDRQRTAKMLAMSWAPLRVARFPSLAGARFPMDGHDSLPYV